MTERVNYIQSEIEGTDKDKERVEKIDIKTQRYREREREREREKCSEWKGVADRGEL
jgi:hypothetical protein